MYKRVFNQEKRMTICKRAYTYNNQLPRLHSALHSLGFQLLSSSIRLVCTYLVVFLLLTCFSVSLRFGLKVCLPPLLSKLLCFLRSLIFCFFLAILQRLIHLDQQFWWVSSPKEVRVILQRDFQEVGFKRLVLHAQFGFRHQ